MSFFGNNNNNNNNSGRYHNRYVVPMSAGTTAAPMPVIAGNSRQSARNLVAEAEQRDTDRKIAAHIARAT